jgi:4-hydroxy-4-methyl-2-oxoglutarate aldolase
MSAPSETDQNALQREAEMMNLEALITERELYQIPELGMDEDELLARYEKLYTGAVSDVLRERCLMYQALPSALVPLRPEKTVAGYAFTVKSAPNTRISGEMSFRTQMLDAIEPRSIVVWETSGDTESTAWGGVMTATAVSKGVRGAVIDGGVRDTRQVLDKDFPLYYRFRSPNGSLGRCLISHYQCLIRIGQTDIHPGDVILGDIDGIVVIPRAIAVEVLKRAETILSNEREIFDWVARGDSLDDITSRGGYF